jgi:hypothetical protein
LDWFFNSISCADRGPISAKASRPSMMEESLDFLFLRTPVTWRAQPLRWLRKARILIFHLCIGDVAENPSLCNHPSSNLNLRLPGGLGVPVVKSIGAWSENPSIRSRARTDTIGNLDSQLASISTLSSFSKVGLGRLFAQVNCLPIIVTSLRSKLSITALNRKGQWSSNRPLLFSWRNLSKLKSPPIKIG